MQTLRWMRVPGDILFATGALLFAWFILGLLTGHSYDDGEPAPLPGTTVEDATLVTGR
jgi:nitric oxide reductase subunit B